ncbi:MAG: hypothetical protein ACFFC3_07085 [Candidatus Odinarchaeota archaeon]
MKTLILAGFGPYGQFPTNLSGEIVNRISNQDKGFSFVKKNIPVSWKRSIRTYKDLLSKVPSKPLLIVILGIHQSNKFHLEKMGWNFIMGKDIDNKFRFGPIKYSSYPFIKTKFNLNELYSILEKKINISISHFAGYYLCNYLYYWALYLSRKEYPVIFIHIPNKGNLIDLLMKVKIILRIIIKLYLKKKL